MVVACWSAKGGVGTTLVAAVLALEAARTHDGALIVDCCGDLPAVFGLPEPGPAAPTDGRPGAGRWSPATLGVADGLRLLPRAWIDPGAIGDVTAWTAGLAAGGRPVVVDCGRLDGDLDASADLPYAVALAATHSLLVTRACYLALRRATAASLRPTGIVLVAEPGRALGVLDVEEVIGVPVVAEVPVDPAVSRSVDAGLLVGRVPAVLGRALRGCP